MSDLELELTLKEAIRPEHLDFTIDSLQTGAEDFKAWSEGGIINFHIVGYYIDQLRAIQSSMVQNSGMTEKELHENGIIECLKEGRR